MRIKTYKKMDKAKEIGIYLSDREMEKLQEKEYDYCSEEILKVYAPLELEEGQAFMIQRTSESFMERRVSGYIKNIEIMYNGKYKVQIQMEDNLGHYKILIETKNLQRWNLMNSIIRRLIKNGHIYKKLYKEVK